MNEQEKRQIFVLKTDKNVFEALDGMNPHDPKTSKIILNLLDYKREPTVTVSHMVNPDTMKVVAHDILHDRFTEFVEYKGTAQSKKRNGKPEARILKIVKRESDRNGEKLRYPFLVQIEVGEGEVIGQGAVKMKRKEESVYMAISELDMKRFAITVLDYVRNVEFLYQASMLRKGEIRSR